MLKISKFMLAVVTTAALAACGGDSSSPAPAAVAAALPPVSVTASTVAAVIGLPAFNFPAGVNELGTTGPTTVAFTGSSASPTFSIGSGGSTATGVASFGSCIFTITGSSFTNNPKLAVGSRIEVPTCSLAITTAGRPANGVASALPGVFNLGNAKSDQVSVTTTVNTDGSITVTAVNGAGITVGKVTLSQVTGT